MSVISMQDSLGQLVAEQPSRSRIFERWGLDYCCGGKQSLVNACSNHSLNVSEILRELAEEDSKAPEADSAHWLNAPLAELADHIVSTHHAYLRTELPRLSDLTAKVAAAHGRQRPELVELSGVYTAFRDEMESHMDKEERILFPYIRALTETASLPEFACGSMNNAIDRMEEEHANAGSAMEQMRALTRNFAAPADACNTYRAMLDALSEMETDLHLHVHKENSILFPRAAALETLRISGGNRN